MSSPTSLSPSSCSHLKCEESSHCLYHEILATIDAAVIVADEQAEELVFLNEAARRLLLAEHLDPTYAAVANHLLTVRDDEPASDRGLKLRHVQLDGRTFSYSVHRGCGRFEVVLLRDESDRQRLESLASAVNTTEHIGHVFAGIRHEIGNPINSIKMTLSVLQRNLQRYDTDTIGEYVERSLSDIARIEYLLRSLRNFNMVEEPAPVDLDLEDFLAQFFALVAGDFQRRGAQVGYHVDADARVVRADPRALQQVLINLLSNAADALVDVEEPRIAINAARRGDTVALMVRDNGCGMDQETQAMLFQPFFTTKERGTGLGMIIIQKMVARMGGEVSVDSAPGQGTTFTLSLTRP